MIYNILSLLAGLLADAHLGCGTKDREPNARFFHYMHTGARMGKKVFTRRRNGRFATMALAGFLFSLPCSLLSSAHKPNSCSRCLLPALEFTYCNAVPTTARSIAGSGSEKRKDYFLRTDIFGLFVCSSIAFHHLGMSFWDAFKVKKKCVFFIWGKLKKRSDAC